MGNKDLFDQYSCQQQESLSYAGQDVPYRSCRFFNGISCTGAIGKKIAEFVELLTLSTIPGWRIVRLACFSLIISLPATGYIFQFSGTQDSFS